MLKRITTSFFIASTLSLYSFQKDPWFAVPYEVRFNAEYLYSYFTHVNNSSPSNIKRQNQNVELFGLGIAPAEVWDVQAEVEVAETTYASGYFRSGALQIRRQWLNDIQGDPLSVATAYSIRGVPMKSLQDISSPYSYTINNELSLAAGKEWSHSKEWIARVWGLFGIGIANRGSPWTRFDFVVEGTLCPKHRLKGFVSGYFGYGQHNEVHLPTFTGWNDINHKSVDVGLGYWYKMGIAGSIGLSYARRVFAHAYPARANTFVLSYHLPFSPF